MALTTAGDLVNYAFRTSGISGQGQTASADDFNDALTTLGAMLAQWQRKRWLVWDLTETTLITTGATSYGVGPGLAFPIARTDRIESAYARLLQNAAALTGAFTSNGGVVMVPPGVTLPTSPVGLPAGAFWNNGGLLMITAGTSPTSTNYVDIPLGIIESREDYNRIALKAFSTVPQAVFYDSGWPTGTLYVWPVPPQGAYELHIFTKSVLPTLLLATSLLTFPPEYIEALKYGLVVHLTMDWGLDPRPAHVAALKAALNTIRIANTQIPELRMPRGLPGRSRLGTNTAAFQTGWMS